MARTRMRMTNRSQISTISRLFESPAWGETVPPADRTERGRILRDLVGPLLALVGSIVALVQVFGSLPYWLLMVAGVSYMVSALAITWTWWPSVLARVQVFKDRRRLEVVASQYFLELQQLAQRFGVLVNPTRSDNIPYVMRHVSQEMDRLEGSKGRLNAPDTTHLNFLFEAFLVRLDDAPKNFTTFHALAEEFSSISALYHYTFVLKPYERLQELGLSMIPAPYRMSLCSDLELQREDYSAFLRDLQTFGERVNLAAGRELIQGYHAPLKRMEIASPS